MKLCLKIIITILTFIILNNCRHKEHKVKHKIFRYNQADGLTSLDPAFARNQANTWATTQLFNGLVTLDSKLQVIPSLAKKWTVSADGMKYSFIIKPNINFHQSDIFGNKSTRSVIAKDFEYSFKRIIDTLTASPGAWIFNDKVLQNKEGKLSDTCFKAVNDSIFNIYLSKPFPAFLQLLTMPYAFVVPKEGIEKWGKEFRIHPIGTGAFTFKQWDEGSGLSLVKNNLYWEKDSLGNNIPYLDGIQVSFISDRNTAFMSFRQGNLDFISGLDENSLELIFNSDGSIKKTFSDQFNIQKVPYLNTEYLGFQVDESFYKNKKHPYLNKKFRQALNYSIDRKKMITYLLSNVGIIATSGVIPSTLASFDDKKVIGYAFDPIKSQKLFKESGVGDLSKLPILKISTVGAYPYKYIAEYIQKEWNALGIKTEVDIYPGATLMGKISNGEVSLFRGSWLGDYPDGENFLSLFYSKNFAPVGPNKTRFKNKKFDQLYEKAVSIQDNNTRYELYKQMDQIILDESPAIFLYYDELIRLTQKNITGLEANPMNTLDLKLVDINN